MVWTVEGATSAMAVIVTSALLLPLWLALLTAPVFAEGTVMAASTSAHRCQTRRLTRSCLLPSLYAVRCSIQHGRVGVRVRRGRVSRNQETTTRAVEVDAIRRSLIKDANITTADDSALYEALDSDGSDDDDYVDAMPMYDALSEVQLGDDIETTETVSCDDSLLRIARSEAQIKTWTDQGWTTLPPTTRKESEYQSLYSGPWDPVDEVNAIANSVPDLLFFFFPKRHFTSWPRRVTSTQQEA